MYHHPVCAGEVMIFEMNPRVSRSSALAYNATSFPFPRWLRNTRGVMCAMSCFAGEVMTIEINPRVSRSSAAASKATVKHLSCFATFHVTQAR
jgi:carbamoylphosphate synthase large subunit